ncbi:unnamed protein product [Miscanthus lutarioriparius]|uniref:RING-type E3 ubiquitin transferase n=1 Tax=Miscanthus lutarioriparius TaxID=422564 RepID=A0A811P9W9_9POAL|nr:unnamed protein product [Miscanthus lutarioriparius]
MAAHNSAACSLCVLFLLLSTATLSASGSPLCAMPSPAPKHQPDGEDDALPLLRSLELNAGYFFGGEDIQFTKDESNETSYSYVTRSFSLLPLHAYRTSDTAVFHVAAILTLSGGRDRESHYLGSHRRPRHHYVGRHSVTFSFEGYYNNGTTSGSGELCMTGTGTYSEENGSTKRLRSVALHLRVPNPSSITDPFITGSLEGNGFKTISLVAYDEDDTYQYHYGKRASCPRLPPSSAAAARGALQAIGANFSCAHLKDRLATSYKLQDGRGAHAPGSSPERRLHISEVQCTTDGSVRAYAAFSNDTQMWRRLQPRPPFMVKGEVVVAEGHWDSARSMLCLRACRAVSSAASMAVNKECNMGMSFWFPGVWTIRDRTAVAGMLWKSSKADDGTNDGSGVSGVIPVSSIDVSIHRTNFSEVKYVYNHTMVEEAKKHYLQDPVSSKPKKKVTGPFVAPNYTDHDFEFHFYGTKDMMMLGGRAYPVTIGSAMVYGDQLAADDSFSQHAVVDMNSQELLSVSYDIREQVPAAGWVRPKNGSYGIPVEERRVTAEGVFDPKTGILCMIACREYNSSTTDCQILITVYLASLDGKAQGHGRGAISSLRNKTDPLFFEKISESISRMDFETILLVISTTLPCVFTILQIFHARRRPEAAAATSVTMLIVLALGYVAPLVVSTEALFLSRRRQYVPLPFQSYVPYELSKAMLRAPTLIALLLQLRLIQLALSARKADADRNKAEASASVAERRALWLCAPLYLIGGALTIIVHVVDALRAAREESSLTVRVGPEPATLWEDLVSSAGLAQDAFLLPQVVMNALSPGASRVRALSPWFYIGGTVVRAMPHVYDVIRAQGYVPSSKPSYVYASPRYDLYGIAWDVIVPCAAALLTVLLFLQQRVGSAPPLFRPRRRLGEYEMVSPL